MKVETMNLHTEHHTVDVKEYIKASVEFALQHSSEARSVVDLGSNQGDAVVLFNEKNLDTVGVELYSDNIKGLPIKRESLEDPFLARKIGRTFDLLFLNHVLEHLFNPHTAIDSMSKLAHADSSFFIAVPAAEYPWAIWDGHYSVWTDAWLTQFMYLHGWNRRASKTVCFRGENVEYWGVFTR